jgi:hypothetical protein
MMQVTKVWWDGEKLMAEPIDPASVYTTQPAQPAPVQEPVGEVREEKQRHFDDDGCVIGSYFKKTVTSGVYKLPHGTKLYTTPPAQTAVPDAIHHTDLSESLEYIQGWNDCRQAMLEMMK